MSKPLQNITDQIDLLENKSSIKRRAAAKKLRVAKDINACIHLSKALTKEVNDKRTWETQYQMIMALGELGCKESFQLLNSLLYKDFEPMVYVALGDAITRIESGSNFDLLISSIQNNQKAIFEGCMRAIAMLRLVPHHNIIELVITFASKNDEVKFWVAAAAAGWNSSIVKAFLFDCLNSCSDELCKAAQASINNKYLKWHPL